jgi:ankyrin repeat protein
MRASHRGHLEIARLLVEGGANVNAARTDTGYTALICASKYGHLGIAQLLAERGKCECRHTERPENCISFGYQARESRHCRVFEGAVNPFLHPPPTKKKEREKKLYITHCTILCTLAAL